MSIVTRVAQRLGREIKKHPLASHSARDGIVSVEPNLVYRPDVSSESGASDAGCTVEASWIDRHN
jgi:hypothetical protein